ncbi:hypothetical protein CASFOL_013682 [Castilleja foliolosa]|uniref:Uncharacterized protein n=1 Tax=Castilleja foliolosa TaxID=1961234 RepID=A0ABD3DLC3_9LAMI
MSIALKRTNSGGANLIEGPAFVQRDMECVSSADESPEEAEADPSGSPSASASASSTSSSIGKNSDEASEGGGASDGEEVQSEYKGGPLDSLESLEEGLPVKKSISKFYNGKSKSYTSLYDAACSSIEEITKPENAYTRKRKNLLAFNNLWDKNRNSTLRSHNRLMSKRPTNSRSMLVLAANMNFSESNSGETSISNSPSPGFCLPPLPPHAKRAIKNELSSSPPVDKFAARCFSLSDLQGAAVAEAAMPSVTGLWNNNSDKQRNM